MIVRDEGSILLLTPVNEDEENWLNENVGTEDGGGSYQPMWPTVVVEPRYFDDLAMGILDAGFSLTKKS